ncbi:MAG: purine-cytosine permease family protein, partial [Solirubrobacteraceae bacterium]
VIPDAERHGKPFSLFTVWFATNMQVTAIFTGIVGVTLGLSLLWTIVAIVIGNVIGGVFMALHSAQGPKLGLPQMIQSRAQFGYFGAIVPLVLVMMMYIGFFASSAVLGGATLASWTGLSPDLSIVIISAVCALLALVGYRMIHAVARWVSLVALLAYVYLGIRLLTQSYPHAHYGGGFDFGLFLLAVSISATWQITYAPYVADYSRYLPRSTALRPAFWWTYGGSVISSIWMMAFGALIESVAAKAFGGGSTSFVVDLASSAHWLFTLVILSGVVVANTMNLYGTFMSSATTLTALHPHGIGQVGRAVYVISAGIVGGAVAIAGRGNFVNNYSNFILFLSYFLIPWTAINLCDFYLVRKERYDLKELFKANGIYRKVNPRTMIAYFAAVAVEIPFMSTTFYSGPMVKVLGGADISWILGIIVSASLYFLLNKAIRESNKTAAGALQVEVEPAV